MVAQAVQEDGGVFYTDDSSVWVMGNTVATVTAGLQAKTALFTGYVKGNGLVLNSAKTQLLFSRGAKVDNMHLNVNGSTIKPTGTLSLLGVTFDREFTTARHDSAVEMAAKQRAGVVARLAHHVPRGPYLCQLAHGLVVGKLLSHAAAPVVTPRTSDVYANAAYSAVQVHVNNVTRTLIGAKKSVHRRVEDILDRAKFSCQRAGSKRCGYQNLESAPESRRQQLRKKVTRQADVWPPSATSLRTLDQPARRPWASCPLR
jgi:hypothetical protein